MTKALIKLTSTMFNPFVDGGYHSGQPGCMKGLNKSLFLTCDFKTSYPSIFCALSTEYVEVMKRLYGSRINSQSQWPSEGI